MTGWRLLTRKPGEKLWQQHWFGTVLLALAYKDRFLGRGLEVTGPVKGEVP